MLTITITKLNKTFPTTMMIDSGADYSMLRRDVVEDGLGIDISTLPKKGYTYGITGKTSVANIDVEITFGQRNRFFTEKLQCQVSLEPDKDPDLSIIGRNPFFYKYRVDFRMGYTDDPALGKFVIYPEEKHRSAKRYRRPMAIKK